MFLDDLSNEDFLRILIEINKSVEDPELSEENILNIIKNEFKKPKRAREYDTIHECYVTLAEVYGYPYDNEFEKAANKQIQRRKATRKFKEKFATVKTAVS